MQRPSRKWKRAEWEQHLYDCACAEFGGLRPLKELRAAYAEGDVAAAVVHELTKRRRLDDADDLERSLAEARARIKDLEHAEFRVNFMEGVDEREDSGWCGEHPRMFSLRPGEDGDGDCLMCKTEELERSFAKVAEAADPMLRDGRLRRLTLDPHTIDIVIRRDAVDHTFEGDFLKPLLKAIDAAKVDAIGEKRG